MLGSQALQHCCKRAIRSTWRLRLSAWLKNWWLWSIVIVTLAAAMVGWTEVSFSPKESPLPVERSETYASSKACRSCHPDAYSTWFDSYHRTMTQAASEDSIVAKWEGELTHDGKVYRLVRDGKRFLVEMPQYGTDGTQKRQTQEVVMSTGSHHMQIYWVALPWSQSPPPQTGSDLFAEHCASCHGPESDEPLTGLERIQSEITETLEDPDHLAHLKQPLTPSQLEAISSYTLQLQVRGQYQQFPFAWWIRGQRWIHEEHTFLQPPPPPESIELWEQRWTDSCDQCHSVGPHNTWNEETARMEANTGELGIACEACHGPALEHAETYRNPLTRYTARLGQESTAHITNPGKLDHERASAICGQCHGELVFPKGETNDTWTPGERLEDHVDILQRFEPPYPDWLQEVIDNEPDLLEAAFWKDGTMRVAGRDYNAMALSGCFTRGELSCMSCHQMHGSDPNDQLKDGFREDAACTECHPIEAAQGSEHTHHPPGSEGSRCMNCHMPHTTIGLLGTMRSHRIDSPNANTADTTGRPDACSLCHLDKPITETAKTLTKWYGQPPLASERYTLDEPSAAILWFLKGDAAQRALIAWHFGWEPAQNASGKDWMAPYAAIALEDDYSAVRYIAGTSLQTLPGFEELNYDYTLDASHWERVHLEVLEQWRLNAPNKVRPSLLMTPEPDRTRIETYLMLQDKSPVSVSE